MHTYALKCGRGRAFFLLAAASIFIAPWLARALETVEVLSGLDLGAPSAAIVFSVLFFISDRWAWRVPVLRAILGADGLSIAGDYDIDFVSGQPYPGRWPATLRVRQRWTSLSIVTRMATGRSSSYSTSAAVDVQGDGRVRVRYSYINEPQPGIADDDMKDHVGAAEIDFVGEELRGRYCNMRPRAGSIVLRGAHDESPADRPQ